MAQRVGWRDVAWAFATVIGLAAGGSVLHFPGSFRDSTWQPAALAFGVILAATSTAAAT